MKKDIKLTRLYEEIKYLENKKRMYCRDLCCLGIVALILVVFLLVLN